MLRLTDEQVVLLLAMAAAVHTRVNKGAVWIDRRPHAVADLYALRAAGLVRSAEGPRRGARGTVAFELSDRGVAEAQHRGRSALQQPMRAPLPAWGGTAAAATVLDDWSAGRRV